MPVASLAQRNYHIEGNDKHYISLPHVLRTPSGLVLIEIQGTIHVGSKILTSTGGLGLVTEASKENATINKSLGFKPFSLDSPVDFVGKFDFSQIETGEHNITLIIDQHQRLRGKLTKLKKPLIILGIDSGLNKFETEHKQAISIDIPIEDVIESKIVFSSRPEPIVYS